MSRDEYARRSDIGDLKSATNGLSMGLFVIAVLLVVTNWMHCCQHDRASKRLDRLERPQPAATAEADKDGH